jgi:hypothetical protein
MLAAFGYGLCALTLNVTVEVDNIDGELLLVNSARPSENTSRSMSDGRHNGFVRRVPCSSLQRRPAERSVGVPFLIQTKA